MLMSENFVHCQRGLAGVSLHDCHVTRIDRRGGIPLRRICPATGGRAFATSDASGHRRQSVRFAGRVRPSAAGHSLRQICPAVGGRAFATLNGVPSLPQQTLSQEEQRT